MKKDIRYTVTPKDNPDKILLQQIVTFGSKKRPFPKNWKRDPMIQLSILEQKRMKVRQSE